MEPLPEPDDAEFTEVGSVGPLTNELKRDPNCVFCKPDQIKSEVQLYHSMGEPVMVFEPLMPVTPGHLLVVPMTHAENALVDAALTAKVMQVASIVGRATEAPGLNIITSVGSAATQSVLHFHVHLVPRRYDDGLMLPWSPV